LTAIKTHANSEAQVRSNMNLSALRQLIVVLCLAAIMGPGFAMKRRA
jgi:hypothetical protein